MHSHGIIISTMTSPTPSSFSCNTDDFPSSLQAKYQVHLSHQQYQCQAPPSLTPDSVCIIGLNVPGGNANATFSKDGCILPRAISPRSPPTKNQHILHIDFEYFSPPRLAVPQSLSILALSLKHLVIAASPFGSCLTTSSLINANS